MEIIYQFSLLYWKQEYLEDFDDPIFICRKSSEDSTCCEVQKDRNINEYPNRSTFILTSQPIPDYLRRHSGFLWSCKMCGQGNSYRRNFMKHILKDPKNHELLFSENPAPSNWGHEKTKLKGKAWAEPSFMDMHCPLRVFDNCRFVESHGDNHDVGSLGDKANVDENAHEVSYNENAINEREKDLASDVTNYYPKMTSKKAISYCKANSAEDNNQKFVIDEHENNSENDQIIVS